jgi:IS30 family transposase
MKKNYTQLSFEQRYQIEAHLQTGRSQKEIAQQIGVHPSTICREFRRNTARRGPTAGCYSARNAQRTTTERHTHKPKALKFNDRIKHVAVQWLQVDKWSPKLISVRDNETGLCPVSTNVSINGYGRVRMATSERINPSSDCTKTSVMVK